MTLLLTTLSFKDIYNINVFIRCDWSIDVLYPQLMAKKFT